MSIKSGQRYKITNSENGVALDLSGVDDKSILGWDFHGSDNQQWIIEKQDDGQWTIRSVRHQKYLGFENNPKDGTPLVGLDRPQLWDIEILAGSEEHDNPRIKLWVRDTLLVLDFPKERSADRPLQLRTARQQDGKYQVWVLEELLDS